jgi:biopolymer transport protein ExbD
MIEIPASKRGNIISDLMPDLTPLLDVMFMLIVFFLLTANAVPYALDVTLPEDNENVTQAIEDPTTLSVTLLPDDMGWKIDDAIYTSETHFKNSLRDKAIATDNTKIVIMGDKDVSMNKLLQLMTFLRKHNIEAADIVMQPE